MAECILLFAIWIVLIMIEGAISRVARALEKNNER
jgi:hypothetical protein